MKLPTPLVNLWYKQRRGVIIGGAILFLILAGIIFRLLTPPAAPQAQPPTYPPITPQPGYRSPQTVNLNRLAPTELPTSVPAYNLTLSNFDNHRQIATVLGFSSNPRTVQNIQIYSNQNFNLTINSQTHNLQLVFNNDSLIEALGNFSSVEALTQKTVDTLKALNVYDSKLSFVLLSYDFLTLEGDYLLPGPEAEAEVIQLILIPQIDSRPIYLQQPMIVAAYNRQGMLTKLNLNYPFANIAAGETTNLLTLNRIRLLPPAAFFPLYITPTDIQEALSGPSGLASITPEQLVLGYFLDTSNNLLQPIFTFKGNAAADQPYIYATLAYPTTPGL